MQIAYKYLLPFCTGLQNVFTPIDIFRKTLYYCISEIIQERSESLAWQFNGTQAVFIQIADRLRRDIVNGIYLPDTQIPTVRQLAFDASVNPNTMQRALILLEEEGLLVSRGTVGRFVTDDVEVIENAKKKICVETVKRFCLEAKALGISYEELIDYMREAGIYE